MQGISEIIEDEAKEEGNGFLCMLLANLGSTLLANSLASKRVRATSHERESIRADKGTIGVRQDF